MGEKCAYRAGQVLGAAVFRATLRACEAWYTIKSLWRAFKAGFSGY